MAASKSQILSPCQIHAQAEIIWVLFGYVVNLHVWYGAAYGTCNVFPCVWEVGWIVCVAGEVIWGLCKGWYMMHVWFMRME